MKLSKHILVYLISSFISGLVPLTLLPLLTSELRPDEFGLMVTVSTCITLTVPLVNWGVVSYVGVHYFRVGKDEFRDLLSVALAIPIMFLLVWSLVLLIFRPWITEGLNLPQRYILAVPFLAAAFFLPLLLQYLFRIMQRPYAFASVELSIAAVNFGLTYYLLTKTDLGWEARILSAFLGNLAISVICLVWLRGRGLLGGMPSLKTLKSFLAFGSGVVPHEIASIATRFIDRLLVAAMLGQFALGQYGVAAQITSVIIFALAALNKAWTPYVFKSLSLDTAASKRELVISSYIFVLGVGFIVLMFNILAPLAFSILVDDSYSDSIELVFWLSVGYLFNGVYLVFVDRIFYAKRTHLLAIVTVSTLLIYIGLSLNFAPKFGGVGVAVAFMCSSAFSAVLVFALAQKLSPLPWLKVFKYD